jgi:ABC-2 type transport system ATP-binding protein
MELLRELSSGAINSNPDTGELSLPSNGDSSLLSEVVRRLDSQGIKLAELGLKQPTLDDVFLAITGHTTEENIEKTPVGKASPK